MHIAIDARLYGLKNAGIGRYTQNLIDQISLQDTHNHYTLITGPHTKIALQPKHCTFISTSIRHYTLAEQISFLKLINSIKCDLFHFPHFNVPLGYNKPYVVTIHDLLWHEKIGFNATTLHPVKYLIKYLGYRLIINNAALKAKHIISPSQFVKNTIVKKLKVNPKKISVTYEAASPIYFQPPQNPLIFEKYHLAKPYIFYTGSLYPHKNVNVLVDTICLLPGFTLAIASARNIFTQRFMAYVHKKNATSQVKYLGFVPDEDLTDLYHQATAYLQPSQSEGFGLPGLEAMAAKCPVICSDQSVLKEIYQTAAHYTNTTKPSDIAQSIFHIQQPKVRNRYLKLGLEQAAKYSWERMSAQTLDLYRTVYNATH